jgi:hypothetical protein
MRRINGKKRKRKRLLAGIPFFCNPRPPTKEKIERSGGEGRWDLELFGAEREKREEEVGWWRSELSSQSGRV